MVAAAAAVLAMMSGAAQAQDINGLGTYGRTSLSAGFVPDPFIFTVWAGGPIAASQITQEGLCRGYIASNPDFTIDYVSGDAGLYISALSDADTTLVVYAPDGYYYCDDDSGGEGETDPGVYLPKPPSGRYQIWLGTYSPNAGTPETLVYVSEVDYIHALRSVAVNAGLDGYNGRPSYGSVNLTGGFLPDPHTAQVIAGGPINVGAAMTNCAGYVSRAMDYRVNFTANGGLPLIFSVDSDTDTTLVVRAPHGQVYCDDDGGVNGANPAVRLDNPAPGQYDVWVGVYSQGNTGARAVLHVSEVSSQ